MDERYHFFDEHLSSTITKHIKKHFLKIINSNLIYEHYISSLLKKNIPYTLTLSASCSKCSLESFILYNGL